MKLNGNSVRSSHLVRVGDRIEAQAPRGQLVLTVVALAEKRQSAGLAQSLYEDHSPPAPPKEAALEIRPRGAGRPTKADRRAVQRLKLGW